MVEKSRQPLIDDYIREWQGDFLSYASFSRNHVFDVCRIPCAVPVDRGGGRHFGMEVK